MLGSPLHWHLTQVLGDEEDWVAGAGGGWPTAPSLSGLLRTLNTAWLALRMGADALMLGLLENGLFVAYFAQKLLYTQTEHSSQMVIQLLCRLLLRLSQQQQLGREPETVTAGAASAARGGGRCWRRIQEIATAR